MKAKICGLTRKEDVELAVTLGAWALGFIFYSKSPRAMTAPAVANLIAPFASLPVKKVGVFVNASHAEILAAVKEARLTSVQLQGDETVEYCQQLKALAPPIDVIKAYRFESIAQVDAAAIMGDYQLVDGVAPTGVWGGVGVKANPDFAIRFRDKLSADPKFQFVLAGGLNPENVRAAIQGVRPMIVDVSSGIEEAPGIKSAQKLKAFFEALI